MDLRYVFCVLNGIIDQTLIIENIQIDASLDARVKLSQKMNMGDGIGFLFYTVAGQCHLFRQACPDKLRVISLSLR